MEYISLLITNALAMTGEPVHLQVTSDPRTGNYGAALLNDGGDVMTLAENWDEWFQVSNCESVADAIAAIDALCAKDLRMTAEWQGRDHG